MLQSSPVTQSQIIRLFQRWRMHTLASSTRTRRRNEADQMQDGQLTEFLAAGLTGTRPAFHWRAHQSSWQCEMTRRPNANIARS